ncbi:MAG: hypothetical protein ACI9E1_000991 [Cryomorphaceae bacterium]|jgi:hypothetical protein
MTIKSPYKRPTQLSDPYQDWMGCEDQIKNILETPLGDLKHEDYVVIFYQNLPAADYSEGVYYLESCFQYMAGNEGLEERIYEGVFWWIDHFKESLDKDKLLECCLDAVWQLFLKLTENFKVIRLSNEELKEFGISESYREIASNTRAIGDYLEAVTYSDLYAPILLKLKEHLDNLDSEIKSYWFREIEYHTRQWIWLGTDGIEKRQDFYDYCHRAERYKMHWKAIVMNSESKLCDGFYQYNQRISL